MVPAMHIGNSLDFREENIKILHQFYICRFDFSISLYVAFVFAAREDLEDEDEDLGELFDDFFFRFCFFGIFGRSVGRMSLNNSDAGCCPICCSKSARTKQKTVNIPQKNEVDAAIRTFFH